LTHLAFGTAELGAGLLAVLAGALFFTNAVEWVGRGLGLSHGALGSVLAALGTALPETLVAVLAVVLGGTTSEIGVGAILGAPLLLSTLAFWVTGMAAVWFARRLGRPLVLGVSRRAFEEDVTFFLPVFAVAALAGLVASRTLKVLVAAGLGLGYAVYLARALARQEEPGLEEAPRRLILSLAGGRPGWAAVVGQLVLALAGMVAGAQLFVHGIEAVSLAVGVSQFALSVFITPLATELPETLNSVLWVRQGKDTLAVGNITGAMALQSSLIPALGMVLTPWRLGSPQLLAAGVALAAGASVYVGYRLRGELAAGHLVAAGAFYAVYVALVV
jgi:cation:H+ antiporter